MSLGAAVDEGRDASVGAGVVLSFAFLEIVVRDAPGVAPRRLPQHPEAGACRSDPSLPPSPFFPLRASRDSSCERRKPQAPVPPSGRPQCNAHNPAARLQAWEAEDRKMGSIFGPVGRLSSRVCILGPVAWHFLAISGVAAATPTLPAMPSHVLYSQTSPYVSLFDPLHERMRLRRRVQRLSLGAGEEDRSQRKAH